MSLKTSQDLLIEPESQLIVLARLSSIRILAIKDVESQKNHITKLLQSIPKEQYKKHSTSDPSGCNFV